MIKIISSLLVLIIALSPIYASSEAIVNSMPGGDLNMISIDDGKLFFQIDSSIYRYDGLSTPCRTDFIRDRSA